MTQSLQHDPGPLLSNDLWKTKFEWAGQCAIREQGQKYGLGCEFI